MPPTIIEPIAQPFPLAITILAYLATGTLILILILLINIHSRLSILTAKLSTKNTHPTPQPPPSQDPEPSDFSPPEPGTPFDEFLKEDPERRSMPKKEQFKAYRKWRAENGLNWSKSSEEG